ncbi:carbonic anhydrase 9 [Limosa lapponica baueri]|uniref:Carbonic anhydrase 9 n=1 Tax=Limosa lapponica baueri TaxID=1758121 RepID=A0A2I0U9Z2_LIMLA|nr:carbonic anhydrase 9 [Limosa lapponica baueri]
MSRAALRVSRLLPLLLLLLADLGRAGTEYDPEHDGEDSPHSQEKDQDYWGRDYLDCAGNMQSPINIDMAKTIFSPQLRPIQLSGYSLPASDRLRLRNNGHTECFLQSLDTTYSHYCSSSLTIPDKQENHISFPLTTPQLGMIHVVHYNTKYHSFNEAMVYPDGLAVLGAFLEVGPRENPYYQEILEHLSEIQGEGKEALVPGFNIAGLLPANLKLYFHYNGSLTTPPCFQTVKWTVFNQTVLLSRDQMLTLVTSLRNDDSKPLQNNYRLVQALHRRQVLASFQTTLFSEKHLPSDSDGSAAGERHSSSSFHAGDVLAVLFGVLFAITALAFLLYIYKHRSQNARLDSPTKSKVIYTAATTENTA